MGQSILWVPAERTPLKRGEQVSATVGVRGLDAEEGTWRGGAQAEGLEEVTSRLTERAAVWESGGNTEPS